MAWWTLPPNLEPEKREVARFEYTFSMATSEGRKLGLLDTGSSMKVGWCWGGLSKLARDLFW